MDTQRDLDSRVEGIASMAWLSTPRCAIRPNPRGDPCGVAEASGSSSILCPAVREIAGVIAWLEANDPEVLAAVTDVDRSLIWAAMRRSPLEHLDDCAAAIESLTDLRDRAHRTSE